MLELRPYQNEALTTVMSALVEEPRVLLQAATGAGKCLAPGTPILLYNGTIKAVEDIAVGDLLMGPDSRPRKVTSLASGTERMYRIVPNKGEPFTVNESHILSLRITGLGKRTVTAPDGRKYSSGDIVNLSVSDYLKSSNTFRHLAKGYRSGCVEFAPAKARLPIPPYILGVWLGDGNSRVSEICNVDFEVIEEWHKYAASIHHECRTIRIPGKASLYRIKAPAGTLKGRGHKNNTLRKNLKDLGILEKKHIPHMYKTSSAQNRLALLAGIIDTDGYMDNNCYDLCVKQEWLAKDVAFIARSLGLAAYVSPTLKTCVNTGATGEYWRVSISGHIDAIPCRVKRRQAGPRRQKKNVLHFGFSIKPVGEGQYYGFELDGPDRRFLLGNFTVTHNTIIFSEIIRRWMSEYPRMRIMIVAHRQELVTQARDKLLKVWPEGMRQIGLACAGAARVDTRRPVTIGSVQTLASQSLRNHVHLLIVDECHHIPALETGGQYHKLITALSGLNPKLRVLGVTATPFRLGHGYIYGDECKPGRTNFFPRLNFQITLNDLTEAGHLAPIRAKEAVDMAEGLSKVKTTRGEYDQEGLNDLYTREVYIRGAVRAYEEYGEGRDKVLVFAVSIRHAELLAEVFNRAGHQAEAVHSEMAPQKRRAVLNAFDHRELKVLVNVGILTEGWDSPRVNLLMMCRPTKAPALFVQMIGRGTRLHPDKEDLLVLDLAGNYRAHGDPSSPLVEIGREGGRSKKNNDEEKFKACPKCLTLVPPDISTCPSCGHQWPSDLIEKKEAPEMVEVKPLKPGASLVDGWNARGYVSQRGNYLLRLTVNLRPGGEVHHYLDIEGAASRYSKGKAHALWCGLTGGKPMPETVREAESRLDEIMMPAHLTMIHDSNGFKKIREFG